MPLTDHAHLAADELRVLEREIASHTTLIDALAFVRRGRDQPIIPNVIVQDEYSHDVVFPWRDGRYLVYATT
jgi:hypothetical protein